MERKLSKKDATVLALCGMLDEEPLTENKKQEWFGDDTQPTNNWCGIEGIKHIWNGSWADPQIQYKGKVYNEWDVQNYIGETFNNELTEQGLEIPEGDEWTQAFSDWCKDNEDWVKSMIEDLEPEKTVKENKQIVKEERYYYGEVETLKDKLNDIKTNVINTNNYIDEITHSKENEYTEKQYEALNKVSSSLSMFEGLQDTIIKLLTERFPNNIRQLTPEEKEYIEKHLKTENKKLTENEMTDMKDGLPDNREPNIDTIDKDVNGVLDGILVVVDPEINTEDYQEVIDRAQEIIEDTPEGKIPFIEDYLNQFIQTCPICGKTFVSKQLLQSGDTCPLCLEQPEQFLTVGRIEPDEEQEKELEQAGNEDLSNDIDIEQDNTNPDEEAIEEFSLEDEE